MTRKLRVAVVGSGIGGLTFATALKNADKELHLYEAASQIAEIGAGIGIWPRTWGALKEMGLEHDLLQCIENKPTDETKLFFEYRKGNQPDCASFLRLYWKGE